jgi:hypothetical protein
MANSAFSTTISLGDDSVGTDQIAAGALFTAGAEQALSGTEVTFTGIPAGTQMIVITVNGLSQNGTATGNFRIGTSGGVESTNYTSCSLGAQNAGTAVVNANAAGTGFISGTFGNADNVVNITMVIALQDPVNNVWQAMSTFGGTGTTPFSGCVSAQRGLSGALERVSISSNANSFDAGSISIMYR